jgi:hypothetical protein
MKKTITATCKETGAKIVSRHCYKHVVDKMTDNVEVEAQRLTDKEFEITITDKIEF